jgi:hypothetical protein
MMDYGLKQIGRPLTVVVKGAAIIRIAGSGEEGA